MNTSLSDNDLMRDSCAMALKYPEAWNSFRCLPGFLYAIDCFSEEAHQRLIDAVPTTDLKPELFAGDIGRPPMLTLPDGRKISPTMLRYAAISRDLGRRFQMHSANIVEIGCGFGGQRKVIADHFERGVYYGFDTTAMIGVTRKYFEYFGLNTYGLYDHVADGGTFLKPLSALLISNYALSEMNRETQEAYCERIVRFCPRGYVLWNNPSRDFDSMTMEEFCKRIPGANVEDEWPKTGDGVRLITWGKK